MDWASETARVEQMKMEEPDTVQPLYGPFVEMPPNWQSTMIVPTITSFFILTFSAVIAVDDRSDYRNGWCLWLAVGTASLSLTTILYIYRAVQKKNVQFMYNIYAILGLSVTLAAVWLALWIGFMALLRDNARTHGLDERRIYLAVFSLGNVFAFLVIFCYFLTGYASLRDGYRGSGRG